VKSPLNLLARLPCAPAIPHHHHHQQQPPQQQPGLRRIASMQALSSSTSCLSSSPPSSLSLHRPGSHGALPRAPSLPAVAEHSAEQSLAPVQQLPPAWLQGGSSSSEQQALKPPRRCHSDTALADLQLQQQQQRERPQWLAQLLHQPRRTEGWGVCSAASLQDIACRQLCATLAAQYQQYHGGKQLPLGLVEAVEAELRCARLRPGSQPAPRHSSFDGAAAQLRMPPQHVCPG
jgi:hypothetical protein